MTLNVGTIPFALLPAPAAGLQGTVAAVIDSNRNNFGQTISSGGGPYHVLAYCDGSNWIVAAARTFWFSPVADRINLLPANPYSDFSGWTFSNTSQATATGIVNPDGTTSPQKIIVDNTTNFHFATSPAITVNGGRSLPLMCSLFARADGITGLTMNLQDSNNTGETVSAFFNLATGVAGTPSVTGHWQLLNDGSLATITYYGNGWYRCDLKGLSHSGMPGYKVHLDIGAGSFAGDGVSGIDLWRLSLLPLAAWDLQARTFFDDFNSISTIDVNDTRAAGFNWYVRNAWPNAHGGITTAPKTQPGDITVSNSILTLLTDRSLIGEGLNTAADNGSGGFVGNVFYPPFLMESVASFNPANALGAGSPAISPVALMSTDLQFLLANTEPFVEIDVCKANATGAGTIAPQQTVHDWNTNLSVNNIFQGTAVVGSPTFTQMHRYSCLYLSVDAVGGEVIANPANGEGFGEIFFFFDGVYTGQDINYNNKAIGTSPALTPSSPANALFESDLRRHALVIGAGTNWPLYVDSIAVWK
jgi:hypothetical protein